MTPAKKRGRGRPRGIALTNTDHAVLLQIATKGFRSYEALRKRALANVARQHSWWVLKRLVDHGFLLADVGEKGIIHGWILSEKARKSMAEQKHAPIATKWAVPIYHAPYRHNALLHEIQDIMQQSPVITEWIPEHVIKAEAMSRFKSRHRRDQREKMANVPDALLTFKIDSEIKEAALELELSYKTKSRMFRKLEAHITNPEFNWAIFVLGNENLYRSYWNTYQHVLSTSLAVKLRSKQNGIYFITLENLQTHKTDARFKGLRHSFSLAELQD